MAPLSMANAQQQLRPSEVGPRSLRKNLEEVLEVTSAPETEFLFGLILMCP